MRCGDNLIIYQFYDENDVSFDYVVNKMKLCKSVIRTCNLMFVVHYDEHGMWTPGTQSVVFATHFNGPYDSMVARAMHNYIGLSKLPTWV